MALTKVTRFIRPRTLAEAFSALTENQARIIAGGIDVILFPNEATALIDITSLPLSGIEQGSDGITIGATTTLTEVLESSIVKDYLGGVVADALHTVASPLQRNLGTIGGSLVIAHPWSDVITLFLALGARVRYFDGEEHEVPLSDFYARNVHRQKMILTQVELPAFPGESAAAFWKFSRTAFDIAILNCAAFVRIEEGVCAEARIAVGGTPARATIATAAGEALVGNPLSPATIDAAVAAAQGEVEVRDDMRASADYRRELVATGIRRLLSQVKERLEGSG